jgi:hypothetical protein
MATKTKPAFDFGEPSEELKQAVNLLKSASVSIEPEVLEWAKDVVVSEEIRRVHAIARYYQVPLFRSENLGLNTVLTISYEAHRLIRALANDFVDDFPVLKSTKGNPRNVLSENWVIFEFIEKELTEKKINLSKAIQNSQKIGCPGRGDSTTAIKSAYLRTKRAFEKHRWALIEAASKISADKKKLSNAKPTKPRGLLG